MLGREYTVEVGSDGTVTETVTNDSGSELSEIVSTNDTSPPEPAANDK